MKSNNLTFKTYCTTCGVPMRITLHPDDVRAFGGRRSARAVGRSWKGTCKVHGNKSSYQPSPKAVADMLAQVVTKSRYGILDQIKGQEIVDNLREHRKSIDFVGDAAVNILRYLEINEPGNEVSENTAAREHVRSVFSPLYADAYRKYISNAVKERSTTEAFQGLTKDEQDALSGEYPPA